MSIVEDLSGHAVWARLESLLPQFGEETFFTNEGEVSLKIFSERLKYVDWCLNKSSQNLLTQTLLNNIDGQLSAMEDSRASLTSFDTAPTEPNALAQNTASFVAFEKSLHNISQALSYPRVQQIFKSEANDAIAQTEESARSSIAGVLEAQRKAETELKTEVELLRVDISKQKTRIELQDQALEVLTASVATALAEAKSIRDSKASEFDGLITEKRQVLADWQSGVEKQGLDYLGKIQKLYRLSGDTTLSGRFIAAAATERKGYLITSIISVLFFCGAIGVTVVEWWSGASLLKNVFTDSIPLLLSRISLLAVFLLPATIFASNATKHRRAEVWLTTMGVRIATLKPYLEELGAEDNYKDELKEIILGFFASELRIEPRQNTGILGRISGKVEVDQIPDLIEKMKNATQR